MWVFLLTIMSATNYANEPDRVEMHFFFDKKEECVAAYKEALTSTEIDIGDNNYTITYCEKDN